MRLLAISIQDHDQWACLSSKRPGCLAAEQAKILYPDGLICANYHKIEDSAVGSFATTSRRYRELVGDGLVSELIIMPNSELRFQRASLLDLLEEYPGEYPILIWLAEASDNNKEYFQRELTPKDFARVRFE